MARMSTEELENTLFGWENENGEIEVHRGSNGYIQQAYEAGLPVSKNSKGEWYVTPYLELTPTGLTSHVPNWFKKTPEYATWSNTYVPQIANMAVNQDTVSSLQDILKSLGEMGLSRQVQKQYAKTYGVTDETLQEQFVNILQAAAGEVNGTDAQLANILGDGRTYTVKELARKYKDLSKEDLSRAVTSLQDTLEKGSNGQWTGSQQDLVDSLAIVSILNMVNENPTSFGDEFKGLLEASEWQKFQAFLASFSQTIFEGLPIATWAFRIANGLGTAATGGDFGEGFAIENRRDTIYNAATGLGLTGVEGSMVAGNVTGSLVNMGVTMMEAAALGMVTGGATGTAISTTLSNTLGTFGGGLIFDFFAHDLPMDLTLFARDLASGKTLEQAWYDESDDQPLFGLFGPKVPAGLAMNMLGDAIMDLGGPFLSWVGGGVVKKIDDLSGGAVGRFRNWVAIKNLSIQQKVSDLPGVGTKLKQFQGM